ncbi:MAG: gluconate 2-dehydrogenase subunit 3 family protein [Acetobacteraceae bacterium]
MPDNRLGRRDFLTVGAAVGATAATAAFDPAEARTYHGQVPWAPHAADVPEPVRGTTYLFFTADEAAFIEAATERLVPKDELGPGARDVGVPLFIDHQLDGAYGRGARWYMQGPWAKGTPTQGFQSRMPPADLYRAAIKAIDAHVKTAQAGKTFATLAPDEQDKVLTDLETGTLDLEGVDAKTFFGMLWQNTKEGMFADPMYGGNKDMAAWKMLGFPGARYDYTDWVGKQGVRYTGEPVAIMGRPAWTPNKS